MEFEWKGFNAAGKVMSGKLDAASLEEAAGKLRGQSVFVSKCVPKGSPTTVAETEEPAPVPPLPDPQPVTLNETNPAPEAMQDGCSNPARAKGEPQGSWLEPPDPTRADPSGIGYSAAKGQTWQSWQSLLEKDLKAIKEVCDFAKGFDIPDEVIGHAAKDMIKEAMIAARMRA
jgi:hypothetical protein